MNCPFYWIILCVYIFVLFLLVQKRLVIGFGQSLVETKLPGENWWNKFSIQICSFSPVRLFAILFFNTKVIFTAYHIHSAYLFFGLLLQFVLPCTEKIRIKITCTGKIDWYCISHSSLLFPACSNLVLNWWLRAMFTVLVDQEFINSAHSSCEHTVHWKWKRKDFERFLGDLYKSI